MVGPALQSTDAAFDVEDWAATLTPKARG